MASWYLVPCLKALFAEFDRIAPSRDHASDGSIGDAAHQAEPTSDHNPDSKGAVHAIDVDSDLHASFTMEDVIQFFVAECRKNNPNGTDRGRLKYFIYNRRIWSASTGWKQETYTGSSPHTEHAHFSCEYASNYENDTSSWGLVERFGDDMTVQEVVDGNAQYDAKTKQGDSPEGVTWWGNNTGRAVWDNQYMPNPISGGKTSGYALLRDLATQIMLVKQGLADLSGKDFTDEAAIVQGVLAGLAESESIQEIADIFIAALPADLAKQVVDEMAKRLAPPESAQP